MSANPAAAPVDRAEAKVAAILFAGLVGFHAWAATVGWTSLSLPGEEFRQAQTALSAQFIQREHNFSLAYPTPVLGKPWSVPMEFPLYQWATVWLSNGAAVPLTQAGRAVSLACFYLTLPALYLLLGRLGLAPARRLVALGIVVTCPLYIFYARAFLIETMALMFGAWFLVGHVYAIERRRSGWLVLATVAGTGAGLVKVTTLMLFLLPAAAWALVLGWRAWRAREPAGGVAVLAWAAAAVVAPCAAAVWWVEHADAVKRLNPLGRLFTSDSLRDFNWGVGQRFAAAVWQDHAAIVFGQVISPLVLGGTALLWVLFARRMGGVIALAVSFFLAVQVAFPVLYALHAYYYVANAFLLLLAVGLALAALFDSRLPRIAVWSVVVLAHLGQGAVYWERHLPAQRQWSAGGTTLALALREVTEPESVLLIAGDDWSSILPHHAQRRACMLPNGRESDGVLRQQVLAALQGEQVSALVLVGSQRDNRELLAAVTAAFDIDARPVFRRGDATVYLRAENRRFAIQRIAEMQLPAVELTGESAAEEGSLVKREVRFDSLPPLLRQAFGQMSPRPFKFYSTFGAGTERTPFGVMYNAHPDTRLWFSLPRGASAVRLEGCIMPDAYRENLQANERTDGVLISIQLEAPDGSRQTLVSRSLDPATRAADRGLFSLQFDGAIPAGATIVVEVLPGAPGNYTRDWCSLGRIEIR